MTLEPFDAALVMRRLGLSLAPRTESPPDRDRRRGRFIEHLWDLVTRNGELLAEDFRLAGSPAAAFEPGPQVAVIGPRERLFIDPGAD